MEIRDPVLEAVRHEFEMCDYPAGFQILSSLGGGTGSGFESLLLDQLKDEYNKMVIITNFYCVVPGGGSCSDAVVEPIVHACYLRGKSIYYETFIGLGNKTR